MARLSGAQVAVAVVVVLVGALAAPGPATAGAQVGSGATHGDDRLEQVADSPTTTDEFVVEVYANGSARWTVRNVRALENESQRQRFETFAQRFTGQQTERAVTFRQRAARLTATGTNATGRSMRATGFERDARIVSQLDDRGVVELSFRWTNFSTRENGRVVIGDAFGSGLAIPNGTSLEIRSGPELDIRGESVQPAPDTGANGTENASGSVSWNGPASFGDARPRVAFDPARTATDEHGLPIGNVALGGVLALVLVVIVGLVVYVRRSRRSSSESSQSDQPAAGADGATGTAGTDGGTTTATTADDRGTEAAPSPEVPPEALRTDEDRVIDLLEANDGRMKQSRIVEETEWSKSKVSTLLSEMTDAGTVSKLRLGRENVVSLEGHEPDVASSPFEE